MAARKKVTKRPAKAKASGKSTAKKAGRRSGGAKSKARTSKLTGNTLDAYVDRLQDWQREIVATLRQVVRDVAPAASEAVKWAQPVFEANGPFAFVKPAAKHVTLGFWRGVELVAPAGLLEGDGGRMRQMKILNAATLPMTTLRDLVRQAVDLNISKGDPTQR
jgi:hypothetical protein